MLKQGDKVRLDKSAAPTEQQMVDAYAGRAGAHLNHAHIEGLKRVLALVTITKED